MQTVETILGNKPSLRRAILLEYMNAPDGILVKEIEKRLGVSGLDKNHLKKLEEFGILEIHHIENERPAGRFGTPTVCMDKGYRLKQDPVIFYDLLEIFIGTEYESAFLMSLYVQDLDPRDHGVFDAIMLAVEHHVDVAALLLRYFYPESPLAKALDAVSEAKPQRQYEQMVSHARSIISRRPAPPSDTPP